MIGSNGTLAGYAGGLDSKEALLRLEGVTPGLTLQSVSLTYGKSWLTHRQWRRWATRPGGRSWSSSAAGPAGRRDRRGAAVSRPAVSQHLRVLKEAGLVTERKEGTRRIYGVEQKAIADLRAYLDSFWEQALAGYKAAAERKGRRE